MKKPPFINNEFYHVLNRGIEKRKIFLDNNDYVRFIHSLYEFNDSKHAPEFNRLDMSFKIHRKRERLVDIVCFCLMPNHYHLLLKQIKEGGISKFLQKLGTGYTMAFNQKYNREGSLFQSSFKAISVPNDQYFIYLIQYIHLNPLEIFQPHWKEDGIINWEKAEEFLNSFRWSSYLDCIGIKNFPSIINKNTLQEIVGESKGLVKYTPDLLEERFGKIQNITLEP